MISRRMLTRLAVTVAAVPVALGLAGCASPVALQPAPAAADPRCADVVVRLPDTVADQVKRETNAQGTGAWGDPSAVVLMHCGVDSPGPTTLPCVSINGVDWIEDDSEAPNYRFVTYGREPAVEVFVNSEVVSGSTTLVDLTAAVSVIEQTRHCVNIDDVTLPDA